MGFPVRGALNPVCHSRGPGPALGALLPLTLPWPLRPAGGPASRMSWRGLPNKKSMSVCMCMCVCVYAYMYLCMYARMYACVFGYSYVIVCIHEWTCMFACIPDLHIFLCICLCTCVYVCVSGAPWRFLARPGLFVFGFPACPGVSRLAQVFCMGIGACIRTCMCMCMRVCV